MKVCQNCDNVLSVMGQDKELYEFCKSCLDKTIIKENFTVISKDFTPNKQIYKDIFVNKFSKLDATLPKIELECPNCKKDKETVFIRYDNENMKFIYLCKSCDHVWY